MIESIIFYQNAGNEYGVLADVVSIAGSIIAASGALIFTWKRRANWQPAEEDLPKASERITGLASAIVIAAIWIRSDQIGINVLIERSFWLLGLAIFFVLLYSYLRSRQRYTKVVVKNEGPIDVEVIGGFWLTKRAKEIIEAKKITVQNYFQGVAYDKDEVWSRDSHALAKSTFVLSYIGSVFCSTVALAVISIVIRQFINQ